MKSLDSKIKGIEVIEFFGHPSIRATHKTTFEITKEEDLSLRGDCVIGVKANKSCIDIDDEVKRRMTKDVPIKITICLGNYTFEVNAQGHPSLTLTDERDIVVRKSSYICPRTLAIRSDRAAIDLPRYIVSILHKKETKGKMTISVLDEFKA
ncbi:MAG: DUF371 domain-containing protein [archaeon]|nr:DUF371 domain-containing protein [archaeon]MCP8306902.1 DUF371 domain-containing protein [archaeon]